MLLYNPRMLAAKTIKNMRRSTLQFLRPTTRFGFPRWGVLLLAVMGFGLSVGITVGNAKTTETIEHSVIALPLPAKPLVKQTQAEQQAPSAETQHWFRHVISRGDTLAVIFKRAGVSQRQLHYLLKQDKAFAHQLTRLIPGQKIELLINDEGQLQQLIYQQNLTTRFKAVHTPQGFTISKEVRNYERRNAFAKGVIKSSLFEAAQKAGLSENLTMDLAYIFGWDIDFVLDIREGDRFTVLYEELYLDGKKVRDGDIIAAEFINQGKTYQAIRYRDPDGHVDYYTPEGRSMRKAFLRTPVDFTRISSRFGKRHHPILKSWRRHTGVDYAAPRGTPVKAAGDGKIIWRARKGGYGKTVVIQHGNRYSTLYAHLSSYDRKARRGQHVKQGQVIGYVGSTGRATGPHLHYEFRVNGVHKNPLTVKLPKAKSIAKRHKQDFQRKITPLLTQLNLISKTSYAALDL